MDTFGRPLDASGGDHGEIGAGYRPQTTATLSPMRVGPSPHIGLRLGSVTSATQQLLEQAKKLPPDEREALAEALWDTLENEPVSLSPEWQAEISSRIAKLERGEAHTVPWSEVEARIRRTLAQR